MCENRNETMRKASVIIKNKIKSHRDIASLRLERYGMHDETSAMLLTQAIEMERAIDLIEKLDGCWS